MQSFFDVASFLSSVLPFSQVIMHLEEQPLQAVVSSTDEDSSSADLLVACYSIIESAVACMANDRFDSLLDDRQKGQVRKKTDWDE